MYQPVFAYRLIRKLLYCLLLLASANLAVAEPTNKLRIISVDSNATEILLALGMGSQIVAADITSEPLLEGQKFGRLGYHRALPAEAILSLQPDLIIGSDHAGPSSTIQAIQNAKIKFIQLNSPENITDLTHNIGLLADELNRETVGNQLIEDIQQLETTIASRLDGSHLKMVFLLDLHDRGLSQAGRDTIGNALINMLNGQNISVFNGYQSVSLESILAMNPDVILVGHRSNGAPETGQFASRYPLLKHTSAGQTQRIISIDASTLIAGLSVTAVQQASQLAEKIYLSAP